MDDYKSYIQSFININDPEIREVVENELSKGKLWPEPLILCMANCYSGGSRQMKQFAAMRSPLEIVETSTADDGFAGDS